jgi:hypothetical protein
MAAFGAEAYFGARNGTPAFGNLSDCASIRGAIKADTVGAAQD